MQVPSIEVAAFQPSGLAGSSASPAEAVLIVGFVVVLGVAAILTFPVSGTLLAIYRRRVLTHMLRRAHPASSSVDAPPLTPTQVRSADAPEGLTVEVLDSSKRGGPAGSEVGFEFVVRACRRAAAVYAVAGVTYTVVMMGAWLWMSTSNIRGFWSPANILVVLPTLLEHAIIFGWPTLLTVVLVAAASRQRRLQVTSVIAVAVGGLYLMRASYGGFSIDVLWRGLLLNTIAGLLVTATLHRRVRAAAPLVLVFMCVYLGAVCGVAALLLFVIPLPLLPLLPSDPGAVPLMTAWLALLALLGAIAATPIGWLLGRRLGTRFVKKRASDQSISLDALWLFCSISHGFVLASALGAVGLLLPVAAFAAYKIVTMAGFARVNRTLTPVALGRRLLILRPFSLGWRSEQLLETIGKKWRYLGSVQVICGPDLAQSTVAPHEFLDFLSGRLARRFIDGPDALDEKLAEADLLPDPDGRFRINVYFCHDDMWRATFARLAGAADVILVDLRGFGHGHEGLGYEIRTLVRSVPLDRIVGLIDGMTDRARLTALAREGFAARVVGSNDLAPGGSTLRLVLMQRSELRPPLREPLWSLCHASRARAT